MPEEKRAEVIDKQSYQFILSEVICDSFEVEVIASNLAGSNKSSITGVLPMLHKNPYHKVSMKDYGIFLIVKNVPLQKLFCTIFNINVFVRYLSVQWMRRQILSLK